ncbi:lactosylceramide 4-alpha-galactosyltransferase-like [Drosophila innubila]|uniref:lactosylceramide 4-alpha-galactosyltransferase-like n=1 Tax=Drosophila innubila TaxID=198719 RepID=UPI00148D66C6|nr:lactosylceramide 4-alpha-galactosyltransferase-like [Drosophila innubila]
MFLHLQKFRIRLLICAKLLLPILLFRELELFAISMLEKSTPLNSFDLNQCYLDELPDKLSSNKGNESIILGDVLLSDIKPTPGRTIFFLETKCQSPDSDLKYIMNLTARQACSIKSAALNNPNFQVFVIFANPKVTDKENRFINVIQSYKNVHLRQLNIWRYAKDTPVEDWVLRNNMFLSIYPTEHTSDLLRLLTLYRFGGIYMDLDVVVLRSLENVPLNYLH